MSGRAAEPACLKPWRKLLAVPLLALPFLGPACGVPISAYEVTATAGATGGSLAEESSVRVEVSSIAPMSESDADPALITATPDVVLTAPAESSAPATDPDSAATTAPSPVSTSTPPPPSPPPAPTVSAADQVAEALRLLNTFRARNGFQTLAPNGQLAAAATGHARHMAQNNFLGHYGTNGSTPWGRVSASGYPGSWQGEAVAAGQATAQAAIDVWINSAPHRAILLSAPANEAGIGYYYEAGDVYGHYWVLEVGTR
jgi:uncharacterized protein YkwD